jgi:hypothetical protein
MLNSYQEIYSYAVTDPYSTPTLSVFPPLCSTEAVIKQQSGTCN